MIKNKENNADKDLDPDLKVDLKIKSNNSLKQSFILQI